MVAYYSTPYSLNTRAHAHTLPNLGTSLFLSRQSTQLVEGECGPDGDPADVGLAAVWRGCLPSTLGFYSRQVSPKLKPPLALTDA